MPRVITQQQFAGAGGGRFFVLYENGAVFEVTNAALGSEAGSLVNDGSGFNFPQFLESPSTTEVVVFDETTNEDFQYSPDEGDSFSVVYNEVHFNYFFNYARLFHTDLSNGNAWCASDYGGANPALWCFYSTNKGASWTRVNIGNAGSGKETYIDSVSARHNGTDALAWWLIRNNTSPFAVTSMLVALVDDTGSFSTQTVLASGWNDSVDGHLFRSCVRYGYSDEMYMLATTGKRALYKYKWSDNSMTRIRDFDAYSASADKHIVSTRAGTLLVTFSWSSGPLSFYVFRSTDGGANWTTIDLHLLVPTSRPLDTWDYIAIDNNDILFIPIESSSTQAGYGLVSTDDGASWSATSRFMYNPGFVASPYDVGGACPA